VETPCACGERQNGACAAECRVCNHRAGVRQSGAEPQAKVCSAAQEVVKRPTSRTIRVVGVGGAEAAPASTICRPNSEIGISKRQVPQRRSIRRSNDPGNAASDETFAASNDNGRSRAQLEERHAKPVQTVQTRARQAYRPSFAPSCGLVKQGNSAPPHCFVCVTNPVIRRCRPAHMPR